MDHAFTASLLEAIRSADLYIWSWPLVLGIIGLALAFNIATAWISLRAWPASWGMLLSGRTGGAQDATYISPFQAFINALSASLGNGSLAGMGTAMYSGGPGAGFWILVLGVLFMAIRFAEVYASTAFLRETSPGVMRGGPMVYLSRVPGGLVLPSLYAFFCLLLTFVTGNAMQCNSIAQGILSIAGAKDSVWALYVVAAVMFLFLAYIMVGGARRILQFSDAITPIKVGLFFVATLAVLVYQAAALWPALVTMAMYAFTPPAIQGALIGYTVQSALRFGIARSVNATEVGLGTSGILFGATTAQHPVRNGIIALTTTTIANFGVCFMLMWIFVATGAYTTGLNGIDMTINAYSTLFGSAGGWIVTLLSLMFGIGCVIAYAYIGRECWMYLLKGRYLGVYAAIFCCMAVFGVLVPVKLLWASIDIVNAGLLIINLWGLAWLMPSIAQGVRAYGLGQHDSTAG
jgi:AGCS family alanine or glycine:cation symporter